MPASESLRNNIINSWTLDHTEDRPTSDSTLNTSPGKMQTYQLLLTEHLTHGQIPSKKSQDKVLDEHKLIRGEMSEDPIKVSHDETLDTFF